MKKNKMEEKKKSLAVVGVKGVQPRDRNGNIIGFKKGHKPNRKAISIGKRKKAMLQMALEAKLTGKLKKEYRAVFEEFGIDPDDMTFEEFLHFKMIFKIVAESDVKAYQAFMDRIKGKPTQKVETEEVKKNYSREELHSKLRDLGLFVDVKKVEDIKEEEE